MFEIWGKETTPFMQSMNFSYGLGCLIVPLIAKSFLLPIYQADEEEAGFSNTSVAINIVNYTREDVKLIFPYSIVALVSFVPAVYFFLLFLLKRKTPPHPSRIVANNSTAGNPATLNPRVRLAVICLMAVFLHVLEGLQITIGTLLPVFAVKSILKLDKSTAAVQTSLFWTTFTFCRLFAIFYVDFIGIQVNLFMTLGIVLLSNGFLLPLAFGCHFEWLLWAGAAMAGIGLSSLWATSFGFIESNFPVTSRIATAFTLASCLGGFNLPFLTGFYIDAFPDVLLYVILASSVALLCLFSCLSFLCRYHLKVVPLK